MTAQPKTLEIHKYPADCLRRVAQPIEAVDEHVRAVAGRMIELMHEAKGAGLAGPQVGLPWRIFVANPFNEPDQDHVFINPRLSNPSRQAVGANEGCLSLPGIEGQINRHRSITIHALDELGQTVQLQGEDLPARVWQHETDHLDGVLIIDKMPRMDRMSNRRALRDLEQAARG